MIYLFDWETILRRQKAKMSNPNPTEPEPARTQEKHCKNCSRNLNPSNFTENQKCEDCHSFLCNTCYLKATKYGTYYSGIEEYAMCNSCCWGNIL